MRECQHCKNCFSDGVNICPNDGMPTLHTISGEPVLEGKYHLEKRLGQGGMGVVYCAKHAYLKTQHAIKVILPDLVGNDPQLVTRFRQEALAAAAIRHHNVVNVTDYGVAQGTMPFLVMEYVEGESLHDLLEREKRLAPEKALELIAAICSGIGAAHRQGIVHRDLKPLNIMILKDKSNMSEAVKILDFGLAKIKSGELLGSFIQAQTTGLMGSPYYMAPEQWSDEDLDARSDIYSLGIMLFQMLAGDVPFKGSSIPAIMKKHLSDPPPTFAELGVQIMPQVELAVRHALEKDPENRTPSVEIFAEELRSAVGITTQNVGAITASNLPISNLRILTNPPHSKVFVDNVAVGESQNDGWLMLEGLQSGNHHLRIRHEGFQDWESSVVCDGKTQQIIAKLEEATGAIPKPPIAATLPSVLAGTPQNFAATQKDNGEFNQTNKEKWESDYKSVAVESQSKKSSFSPALLAIIGISGILLLTFIGVAGAFLLGFVGPEKEFGNANSNVNTNVNTNSQTTPPPQKARNEMIKIPGGRFTMGRSDGAPQEQPEHDVEVRDFWIDKTEVTNAEYYDFVKATNHPVPAHWSNGKPVSGEEEYPVVRVSQMDVKAFADWRSKRDGARYRLPTESEWEYVARNGGENNLYPWGDNWQTERAVVEANTPKPVGSISSGANKFGVLDLIGNVWEWTGSELAAYPNSKYDIKRSNKNEFIIRGGGYVSKASGESAVTSTTRLWVEEARKDGFLGFRLIRTE